MGMREKLIEVFIDRVTDCDGYGCITCEYRHKEYCRLTKIADDFIANDVVPVVRCKDCKHFCPYEGEGHKGDCAELVGLESCVYEDDYCSYGERRTDG